jgi:hypothetical protein
MPNSRPDYTRPEKLNFGLNAEIPRSIDVAWGARLIYPNQMVSDRQSMIGSNATDKKMLLNWLNGGVFAAAMKNAKLLADARVITPQSYETVIVYEDESGIIKGNPNGSGGYLYVCAYLKPEKTQKRKIKRKVAAKKYVKK